MFVRFGRPELSQVRGRRSWKAVIGEDGPGAYHHAIFYGHGCAYVYKGVDLDPITDPNAICDIAFFSHNALFPNTARVSDVDIIPDGGPRPDFDFSLQ